MKKIVIALLGVFSLIVLAGCSGSEANRAARDLAPDAFQELRNEVGNTIRIREVDYACFVTESDGSTGKSCLYAVIYTAGSSTRHYALIGAYADTDLPTTAYANLLPDESFYNEYRTQILGEQYKNNIENELNADDSIDSYSFGRGDLSARQIRNAMDKVN